MRSRPWPSPPSPPTQSPARSETTASALPWPPPPACVRESLRTRSDPISGPVSGRKGSAFAEHELDVGRHPLRPYVGPARAGVEAVGGEQVRTGGKRLAAPRVESGQHQPVARGSG